MVSVAPVCVNSFPLKMVVKQPLSRQFLGGNLRGRENEFVFFSAVLETVDYGVLKISESGELVYANSRGRDLCQQLSPQRSDSLSIPAQVWRLCELILEGRNLFPGQKLVLEERATNNSQIFHIQVRQYPLDRCDRFCMLAIIKIAK